MSEKELYKQLEEYDKEVIRLSKENEKLKKELEGAEKIISDLAQRIKKAIEYIQEHCEIRRYEDKGIDEIGKVEGIPLLEILKGEKNE